MSGFLGRIQDSELEVMRVLWSRQMPMALLEIRQELSKQCAWEDSTVKTLLKRLCEKGAVTLVRRGVYRAEVSEEEYGRLATKRYVDKMFQGSAKKLVASMLSEGQLSEKDFEELSQMLKGGSK